MNELKVFVYGTLKVGGRFSPRFDAVRTSAKVGKIKGELYDLGSFPGVKLRGDSEVVGEVHTYSNAKEVEAALDRIEGYGGPDKPHNLYEKRIVLVQTDDGEESCIMYEFSRDIEEDRIIPEGVWKV